MCGRCLSLSAAISLAVATTAAAQATIQQPSVHVFATSTTVLVPDSGSASLAGIGSSTTSGAQLGIAPIAGRGSSSGTFGGGLGITAQISDLRAMDAQLLGSGAAPRPGALWPAHLGGTPTLTSAAADSIAEIRLRQAAQAAADQREWRTNFELGKKALAEGKAGVAKIYFQTVARQASGELKEQALLELKALAAKPASRARR